MKVERIIQLSGENFNFSYDILFKLQEEYQVSYC